MRRMYTLAVTEQQRTEPAIDIYLVDSFFVQRATQQRRVYVSRLVITNRSIAANSIKQILLAVDYGRRGHPPSNVAIPHDSGAASAVDLGSAEVLRVPTPIAAGESISGTALFPMANSLLQDNSVNSHTVIVIDAHDREARREAIVLREMET